MSPKSILQGASCLLSISLILLRSAALLALPLFSQQAKSVDLPDARVPANAENLAFQASFEEPVLNPGWKLEGNVALDTVEAFKGRQSLVLTLSEDNVRQKTAALGPSFAVAPGRYEIKLAAKSELASQDNSYNGSILIEYLNGSGEPIGKSLLIELFEKKNWHAVSKQIEVPSSAATARFVARINKETPGKFWLDEVSASAVVADAKAEPVQRMVFTTAQEGNLLFPTAPRTVRLTVLANAALPDADCLVSCVVRDYWGAEQSKPLMVKLESKAQENDFFVYEGQVDLFSVPMELGRYYEIHGEIARKNADPFRNYSSLAILPEAPANRFKPEEIPFTSRNWDNRFPEFIRLTKRLGIRTVGGYVTWNVNATSNPTLAQDNVIREQGLGLLQTTMAMAIERRGKDWEKWNETTLGDSIRTFLTTYKDIRPLIINLGNEPHSKGNEVKVEVEAYKILYNEIKKFDPGIYVVGTSVGASNEDYFKAGFGEWCDAYDFHVYETAEKVRDILEVKYPALFKKYGFAKPIWSTELGLNSQGMKRQTVAAELIKKFANFFAGGGANVSWFGLLYPDPDGSKGNSSGSAHNVFDCRYNAYAPKLDAIAYYNAVNGIANKRFVTDKVYGGNLRAFLFRDPEGQTLQVLYKNKGCEDVFLPLPGVDYVQLIRIDGRRSDLHPSRKGITLTVDEDPVLLLYKSAEKTLPVALEAPAASLVSPPSSIVSGQPTNIDITLNGARATSVYLQGPSFWKITEIAATEGSEKPVRRFSITSPQGSSVREADLKVILKDAAGQVCGDLVCRPQVTGMISVGVLAVAVGKDKPVGVKLLIRNNGPQTQDVTWDLALTGEQSLKSGAFSTPAPTEAYFSETPSGTAKIAAHESFEVFVSLSGVDLYKLYRIRASVRDASGRIMIVERPMGGFVGVHQVSKPPTLDGVVGETEWEKAASMELNQADQFFVVMKKKTVAWDGPQDLSATLRFLWDDQYLYVAAHVTDDLPGKPQPGEMLWSQDGIQMLIDGDRTSAQKKGKSDYAMGIGVNGPQAWCFLAADPSVAPGDARDIKVSGKRKDEKSGNMTYEIAIPWSRLTPFKPEVGANLGLAIALNEDDGSGRDSYMAWFGSLQTKDVDMVGDLILQD